MPIPIYDHLDYDRMINWDKRLAVELPFIEGQLAAIDAKKVLDVACGTGQHAIALARRGYEITGVDVSTRMIEKARENAEKAQTQARFIVAGFGELAACLEIDSSFDALLCLGSSLPHIPSPEALAPTLADFAAVLRPGGLLIVQNRNFDQVLLARDRWQPPQAHREGNTEWLFLRFYDFNDNGSLTFNVVTLKREGEKPWQQHVESTLLWPLRQADLAAALASAGFGDIQSYGNMQGAPFAPGSSPNLIVTARRA